MDFTDKVALITGGGGGIGRATALAFAKAGAKVVVVDRDVAAGEATAGIIRQQGGEAKFDDQEKREYLALLSLKDEAMSEDVGHLTGQASCWSFVVHVALRQPIDHLQGEVGAGLHRLLIGAFDVNQCIAALQAEMRGSLGRGRRALTPRTRAVGRRRWRGAVDVARFGARAHGGRRCAERGRRWRRRAGRGWGRGRHTWSRRGRRLSARLREGASS